MRQAGLGAIRFLRNCILENWTNTERLPMGKNLHSLIQILYLLFATPYGRLKRQIVIRSYENYRAFGLGNYSRALQFIWWRRIGRKNHERLTYTSTAHARWSKIGNSNPHRGSNNPDFFIFSLLHRMSLGATTPHEKLELALEFILILSLNLWRLEFESNVGTSRMC